MKRRVIIQGVVGQALGKKSHEVHGSQVVGLQTSSTFARCLILRWYRKAHKETVISYMLLV